MTEPTTFFSEEINGPTSINHSCASGIMIELFTPFQLKHVTLRRRIISNKITDAHI